MKTIDRKYDAIDSASKYGLTRSGAPRGNTNALKHGNTTAEAKAFRRDIKQAIQLHNSLFEEFRKLGF